MCQHQHFQHLQLIEIWRRNAELKSLCPLSDFLRAAPQWIGSLLYVDPAEIATSLLPLLPKQREVQDRILNDELDLSPLDGDATAERLLYDLLYVDPAEIATSLLPLLPKQREVQDRILNDELDRSPLDGDATAERLLCDRAYSDELAEIFRRQTAAGSTPKQRLRHHRYPHRGRAGTERRETSKKRLLK